MPGVAQTTFDEPVPTAAWRHSDDALRIVERLAPHLGATPYRSGPDEGHLLAETTTLLADSGVFRMRLCCELGGLGLSIADQIAVLSDLAARHPSAAWCAMAVNMALGLIGETMPDSTVARVFAKGVPIAAHVQTIAGTATPVEGGYRISGTWRLATGVAHAGWIIALTLIDRDPSRRLPFVVPVADATIRHTWDTIGLSGTGADDFALDDIFVPAEMAGDEAAPFDQRRGERRYDLAAVEHLGSYEHLAFSLGVTSRALHEMRKILRGSGGGYLVGDRELVQGQFGRAVMRLCAMEALALALFERIDRAALGDETAIAPGDRGLPRALAAQGSELALETVQLAFRRSGFAALLRGSVPERLLRDMNVAAAHAMVDDTAFAGYAEQVIELGLPKFGLGGFSDESA